MKPTTDVSSNRANLIMVEYPFKTHHLVITDTCTNLFFIQLGTSDSMRKSKIRVVKLSLSSGIVLTLEILCCKISRRNCWRVHLIDVESSCFNLTALRDPKAFLKKFVLTLMFYLVLTLITDV